MPAAAVIPAPIAYIKVVAVKKLVVGSRGVKLLKMAGSVRRRTGACTGPPTPSFWIPIPAIDLVGMLWAGRQRIGGQLGVRLCPRKGV